MSRLDEIRADITRTDDEIAKLLVRRFGLSREVAAFKLANGMQVLDSKREQAVIDRVSGVSEDPVTSEGIANIYRSIMAESRAVQEKLMASCWLIGMPGCGKTTVGKALAELLGRPFMDADAFFEEKCGISPARFIETRGVSAFRDEETRILSELAGLRGYVIALGGGIVERAENRKLIRPGDLIVYIKRGLDELSLEDRPVSASRGVRDIYDARHEAYESWADIEADNTDPVACARMIADRAGL